MIFIESTKATIFIAMHAGESDCGGLDGSTPVWGSDVQLNRLKFQIE